MLFFVVNGVVVVFDVARTMTILSPFAGVGGLMHKALMGSKIFSL